MSTIKKFYNSYQYIAFLLVFPLSCAIFYHVLNRDIFYTFYMVSLPLLVSYIVPAIGTNVIKLWEFNTKYKIGNFRAYHGFVLGASFNIFGVMAYVASPEYTGILSSFCFCMLLGSLVGFWNWIYDIYAIKCKFIIIHSIDSSLNKSPHEIAFDYAPIYFYVFGFVYAAYIKIGQAMYYSNNNNFIFIIVIMYILAIVVPAVAYILSSYIRYKNFGIPKIKEEKDKRDNIR